jgi:NAD(P)-dependent dehydrogenase (short-subunit alcohol dehydrogenase family)
VRCNAVAPGWIDTDLNEAFVEAMAKLSRPLVSTVDRFLTQVKSKGCARAFTISKGLPTGFSAGLRGQIAHPARRADSVCCHMV